MTNDPSISAMLRSAAYFGDLHKVRRLCIEGADVNIWDEHGYTAMTYAAAQGRLEIVEFLLENGGWAEPHEDYDTYDTPLMIAVVNGHLEVVKKLIEKGADPKRHVGKSQATAEFYARENGHKEIGAYLSKQK